MIKLNELFGLLFFSMSFFTGIIIFPSIALILLSMGGLVLAIISYIKGRNIFGVVYVSLVFFTVVLLYSIDNKVLPLAVFSFLLGCICLTILFDRLSEKEKGEKNGT